MNRIIKSLLLTYIELAKEQLAEIKNKHHRKRTREDYYEIGRMEVEIYVIESELMDFN